MKKWGYAPTVMNGRLGASLPDVQGAELAVRFLRDRINELIGDRLRLLETPEYQRLTAERMRLAQRLDARGLCFHNRNRPAADGFPEVKRRLWEVRDRKEEFEWALRTESPECASREGAAEDCRQLVLSYQKVREQALRTVAPGPNSKPISIRVRAIEVKLDSLFRWREVMDPQVARDLQESTLSDIIDAFVEDAEEWDGSGDAPGTVQIVCEIAETHQYLLEVLEKAEAYQARHA